MGGFFFNLGKTIGQTSRKANWVVQSMTGSESDALQAEYAVGKDLAQAYTKENPLSPEPEIQAFLDPLTARLLECVSNKEYKFCFRAANINEFNAFALPGGFIFVMRTLLDLCEWNEDEVAFVLSHEMGHVLLRHAINRLMASSAICAGLAKFPIGGLLGVGILQVAMELLNQGHSREQELEADKLAVQLSHFAGFDPEAGKHMLARLNTLPSEKWLGSTYFSSHPPFEVRVENIDKHIQVLRKGSKG